jgi:uncharacterized membrane protein
MELPSSTPTVDQKLWSRLPILFVFLSALLGAFYAFVVPPLQVPDEFAHLFRAYGLSEGYFVAPRRTPVPTSLSQLTGRYPPHLESVGRISARELMQALREPLNPADQIAVPNEGMNVNTWIPYMPSAIVIFAARELRLSPLAITYLARLANLAGYIALTWLALRILPAGRIVLFTVALMPMVLHQAAGLSWDSITFAIAFLFCALILRARTSSPLKTRDCALLWASVLILSLCKVDFVLLPLLILIPVSQHGSRKRQILFLTVCAAGAFIISVGWQVLNRDNLILFKQSVDAQFHTNFPDNIWYLYYNTGYYINAVGRSIIQTGFLHLTEFVGTFGWLTVRLPPSVVLLYIAELVLVGLTESNQLRLSWIDRGILFGCALMGCIGAMVAMWLQTPNAYIQEVILHNVGTLYGLQGRHYIPFAFPAILVLSNRMIRIRGVWLYASALAVILISNGIGLAKITQTYYRTTGLASVALVQPR